MPRGVYNHYKTKSKSRFSRSLTVKKRISKTCKEKGIGKWMKGRKMPKETIEKIKKKMKGKCPSPQCLEASRLAHLGIPRSDKTKEKLKKANLGKKHTEETKIKMSINSPKYWLGKHMSKKMRKKLSKSHIGLPSRRKGKHLSEITKERLRQSAIKQLASGKTPTKETSIEKLIEQELKLRGLKYEKQKPLCNITITDFYLPEDKIVVYCDGDYWHSIPKVKKRDATQNLVLTMNGYKVFRFTETEINKSAKKCIRRIITEKGVKYLEGDG